MTTQSFSAGFPDPEYWDEMKVFVDLVVDAIQKNYGIFCFQLTPVIEPLGFTDSLTGLSALGMFQIYVPQWRLAWNVAASQFAAFMHDPAGLAAALVTQMANAVAVVPPAPLPPPAPPLPPLPVNPIGASFDAGDGVTGFTDLGSPNVPVGGTISENGLNYLKICVRWPFGTKTYFVESK
jgi:hypothetical protein